MSAANVSGIERVELVTAVDLPNGEHFGRWSGYVVHVEIGGRCYRMAVDNGMRGNVDCIVAVADGRITVRTLNLSDRNPTHATTAPTD